MHTIPPRPTTIFDFILVSAFLFSNFGSGIYYVFNSILVDSLAWSKIRANLPWLVDAGGCVLLDTCVSLLTHSKILRKDCEFHLAYVFPYLIVNLDKMSPVVFHFFCRTLMSWLDTASIRLLSLPEAPSSGGQATKLQWSLDSNETCWLRHLLSWIFHCFCLC